MTREEGAMANLSASQAKHVGGDNIRDRWISSHLACYLTAMPGYVTELVNPTKGKCHCCLHLLCITVHCLGSVQRLLISIKINLITSAIIFINIDNTDQFPSNHLHVHDPRSDQMGSILCWALTKKFP